MILQAFQSEEQNRLHHTELVNAVKHQHDKGKKPRGQKDCSPINKPQSNNKDEAYCDFCKKSGHWTKNCFTLKVLKCVAKGKEPEGAKKTEVDSGAVTEIAGQASDFIEYNAFTTSHNNFCWNTDTGATSSMTPHKTWLRDYKPYRVLVRLADNSTCSL